jgi:hypothetical protein
MANHLRRWNTTFIRVVAASGLAGALALGGFALSSGTSSAQQGTLSCPNFNDTDIPTPPPGTTGFLFIGTSISTNTSDVTVMYTGGSQTVAGIQEGNGAFHYVVNIPQGATVTSATVTGATGNTVVTVSGCLNGSAAPTTTEAPSTTLGPSVSPNNVSRGATVSPNAATRVPTPVVGVVPRTTG